MLTTRVVHPVGFRPRTVIACTSCAVGQTLRLPGTELQEQDPARLNQNYRCAIRLPGCQHTEGLAR